MTDALKPYQSKRDFSITSEPAEGGEEGQGALTFVIQKHWASRLHYDLRLEWDGTMKSWAVPKGPSYDSHDKRMAVHVEDHPIAYSSFEGTIPEKQYGAGKVIIWDRGSWQPLGDPRAGYEAGNLKFELHGHKMHGRWVLIRMKGRGEKQAPWLLIKEKNAFARPAGEAPPGAVTAEPPATLQRAFDGSDSMPIVYFLFDASCLDGYDMRTVPLEARRAARRVPGAARRQAGQRHHARAGRTHAREREK